MRQCYYLYQNKTQCRTNKHISTEGAILIDGIQHLLSDFQVPCLLPLDFTEARAVFLVGQTYVTQVHTHTHADNAHQN